MLVLKNTYFFHFCNVFQNNNGYGPCLKWILRQSAVNSYVISRWILCRLDEVLLKTKQNKNKQQKYLCSKKT